MEFLHIRFDRKDIVADKLCPPLVQLVKDAQYAFLPAKAPVSKELAAILPSRIIRFMQAAEDHKTGSGTKRQSELEEAVAIALGIVQDYESGAWVNEEAGDEADGEEEDDGDEGDGEDEEVEAGEWQFGMDFLHVLKEKWRDEDLPESFRLSTGRNISTDNLTAAVALMQCEKCICAFMNNDTKGVAYLMADIHVLLRVCAAGWDDDDRRRDARSNARKAHAGKEKDEAMGKIRAEWDRWQSRHVSYANDAEFAREMQRRYPVIKNEGSIKNSCGRWRAERKSSG